jgi:hypothetical protein
MSKKKTKKKNVKRPLSRVSARDLVKATGGADPFTSATEPGTAPLLGFPSQGGRKHAPRLGFAGEGGAPLLGFPSEGTRKHGTTHAPLLGMPSFK